MQKEKIKVLRVRFDKVTLEEATKKAINWAKERQQRYLATPNPEILLEANVNPKFLRVLNKSALNIPDGIGILWAATYLGKTRNTHSKVMKFLKWLVSIIKIPFCPGSIRKCFKQRVTGVDLMQTICKEAANENLKIFLLGGRDGVAEKVKEILEKRHPKIKITGTDAGSPKLEEEKDIIGKIKRSGANILFVAYGAPNQEIWIAKNLKKMPEVKIAVGIGGAFNFIAGTRKRAPKWMQKLGLEWLFRLIQEPSRIKRIYNATIKFPITVFRSN